MNTKQILSPGFALGLVLGASLSTVALAQSGSLRSNYPELANLYNALDVTQAEIYDAVAAINADPAAADGHMELKMHLDMMADMGHGGHGGMQMEMDMNGHYGELEVQSRVQLYGLLQRNHDDNTAAEAFRNSDALPTHAAMVLSHGRDFERTLWDIYANRSTSMYEKQQQVDAAVQEYLTSDPRHAVSTTPKASALYLEHDYANAFKMGYPRLSGLMFANQWLQLASLEAIIIGQLDPQFDGNVPLTQERYWNKVGSDTGMTMFPAPTEMPSVPAIAPSLYSQAPVAAVIIDNLNMLESALADIIAYPGVPEREELMDSVAIQYTDTELYLADTMNYLLNALRGGIFDQGGPAIGELDRSERNRSREAMDMTHTMIMSSPN